MARRDAETCMHVLREASLVEGTFLGPSDMSDMRVRHFLVSGAIPFAGHPTVASLAPLLHRGVIDSPRCNAGPGPVRRQH